MALRNEEIGLRLKELRGRKPQTVVAEDLGVGERTYQTWEQGTSMPSYRNLQRMAAYFGVSEEFILTGERRREEEPVGVPRRQSSEDRLARLEAQGERVERLLEMILLTFTDTSTRDLLAATEAASQALANDFQAPTASARKRSGQGTPRVPKRKPE